MSLETSMPKTALRLIEKNGRPVTVLRVTAGGYDPATSKTNAPVEQAIAAKAIVNLRGNQHATDGSKIRHYDATFTMAGVDVSLDDLVVHGGLRYRVNNVEPQYAGNATAALILRAVRA